MVLVDKLTVKAYKKLITHTIDKALLKLENDWYNEHCVDFFDLPYEKRIKHLEKYMTKYEVNFIQNAYTKNRDLQNFIVWCTS